MNAVSFMKYSQSYSNQKNNEVVLNPLEPVRPTEGNPDQQQAPSTPDPYTKKQRGQNSLVLRGPLDPTRTPQLEKQHEP